MKCPDGSLRCGPAMQLSAIVEALLIASQNPLPSEEIARLVRARVAEADDVRLRETEEGKEIPALPEWLVALAATWLVRRAFAKKKPPGCGADCGCPAPKFTPPRR